MKSLIEQKKSYFGNKLSNNKHWFTPKEAADILGITAPTIRNLIETKSILAHNFGKERPIYLVPKDALILFLSNTACYTASDVWNSFNNFLSDRSYDELLLIQTTVEDKLKKKNRFLSPY